MGMLLEQLQAVVDSVRVKSPFPELQNVAAECASGLQRLSLMSKAFPSAFKAARCPMPVSERDSDLSPLRQPQPKSDQRERSNVFVVQQQPIISPSNEGRSLSWNGEKWSTISE